MTDIIKLYNKIIINIIEKYKENIWFLRYNTKYLNYDIHKNVLKKITIDRKRKKDIKKDIFNDKIEQTI